MMTIFWYWRPEEVPDKFRVPHGEMEVFVSSLRDDNFVSCIEEKCFVLTLHQYARYFDRLLSRYHNRYDDNCHLAHDGRLSLLSGATKKQAKLNRKYDLDCVL